MTRNRKGRAGGHQATLRTIWKLDYIGIGPRVKCAILALGVWGWLPVGLVSWIVRHGGKED